MWCLCHLRSWPSIIPLVVLAWLAVVGFAHQRRSATPSPGQPSAVVRTGGEGSHRGLER